MTKVIVVGESCLDVFIYCEANRLAPDLPIPVLEQVRSHSNPGMASNVYRNIKTKLNECQIITNDNWRSVVKTRYVHESTNHTFVRVDTPMDLKPITEKELNLDSDIVVISDYDKGFLTREIIEVICKSHPLVFLDTKKPLGNWAREARFIKINDYEFKRSSQFLSDELESRVIHTRGAKGCDYRGVNYAVPSVEIRDSTGAGDSFMAALVVNYAKSRDIIESIKFANDCASKVVQTRGVGVI